MRTSVTSSFRPGAGSGRAAIGAARNDDVDFIDTEHAGRTGRKALGEQCSLEPFTLLLPMAGVCERGVTPAQRAIGVERHHPGAFADRRFEPDGIFALGDQSAAPEPSLSCL